MECTVRDQTYAPKVGPAQVPSLPWPHHLFSRCALCLGDRVLGANITCPGCDGLGCLPIAPDQIFDVTDAAILADDVVRELHRLGVARREILDQHHQSIAFAIATTIGRLLDDWKVAPISFSDFGGHDDRHGKTKDRVPCEASRPE
jgi:hypothetical protein